MAAIILVHSALGLTDTVLRWAEEMRDEGHSVATPDLYGGDVYADLDEGVERADSGEMASYVSIARDHLQGLEGEPVFVGFSLGAAVAQILALTDPSARGVVLMHGAMSPAHISRAAWGDSLVGQLHYASGDPWCEPEEVQAFVRMAPDDALEEFTYDGSGHLFGFEESPDYDAYQAALMHERVLAFLASL